MEKFCKASNLTNEQDVEALLNIEFVEEHQVAKLPPSFSKALDFLGHYMVGGKLVEKRNKRKSTENKGSEASQVSDNETKRASIDVDETDC